ncbi:MAG: malto-oligosyltrehalose trehalohydrolase [Polyangia bacterium]
MTMIGATVEGDRTHFRVWAPRPRSIELELIAPRAERVPLHAAGDGWFSATVDGVGAGARYFYLLDGERRRPDPAARALPDGVHGAAEVVEARAFHWKHPRRPRRMRELVIYELHVGTFTPEGTFDAAVQKLDRLVELGVTAIEILPVASFPGARNWGYDGTGWFAPQRSYGGPDGLRRLIDACHARGLSFLLDVVYNHFGPEGNYVGEFAPYFTSKYATPWGDAIDYEDAPPVRQFVLDNARMWFEEYRVDGLRLDAVHAIYDASPRHIVAQVAALAHDLDRLVIAESDLGEVKVIQSPPGGWGCDAQWSDDFHHALHAVVTGEASGYYQDFGSVAQLATAVREGFVYQGQYAPHRKKAFGTPSRELPGERFVVCAQNHDQVGNRARGERLAQLRPGCEWAVAAAVLLAPSVPLLFMGEEHADPAPFQYFTDHQDARLAQAVRDGRRREFASQFADVGEVPDPQAPETRDRSVVQLALGAGGRHGEVRRWYRALITLRREHPELVDKAHCATVLDEEAGGLAMIHGDRIAVAVALRDRPARLTLPRRFKLALDAADFGGAVGAHIDGNTISLPPWGAAILLA